VDFRGRRGPCPSLLHNNGEEREGG
jgi:hypothetical protein